MSDREMSDTIYVCAGPPKCPLEDDEAVAAQKAGCIWCRVITIHPDGTETEKGPRHD